LAFDIIGAFILAIDAIGVDRVHGWGMRIKISITEDRTNSIGCLVSIALIGVAFWLGILTLEGTVDRDLPTRLSSFGKMLLLIMVGGIFGAATARLFLGISWALLTLQNRARRQAVGILGFSVLAIGFILQSVGLIWQGLQQA